MREHEDRSVIWWIFTPPTLPSVVGPWAAHGSKHVSPNDPRADVVEATCDEVIINASCPAILAHQKELKGRRALVTGGSRGIGGAIVRRLLSGGARVVAVARNRVEDFPAEATWIDGDVSSVESVQAIVERVSAILGGVDILVNN